MAMWKIRGGGGGLQPPCPPPPRLVRLWSWHLKKKGVIEKSGFPVFQEISFKVDEDWRSGED